MSNVSELLAQRTRKNEQSTKMTELASKSASGNLSSFTGLFSISELSEAEKSELASLLEVYATDDELIAEDLKALIAITSEVKAINNQAALLHGERIKKAQSILTRYRDGAFTTWLIKTYGNRQTPYNFLQYHEFYHATPKPLRNRLETMPRQAIYTLASREGAFEKKQRLIESYQGETKAELLTTIREEFPLASSDKRQKDFGLEAIKLLEKVAIVLEATQEDLSDSQKASIKQLLKRIVLAIQS
ncbi:MAG: CT583 family protein [Parachlamydiaceae bacterium]|nr:CT583 family protein [Parachlamydiaceae bacterium]